MGLPAATAALLNKKIQYRCSHGIGKELHCHAYCDLFEQWCFQNLLYLRFEGDYFTIYCERNC